ncbi:hypothetical protein HPB51_002636 [Rhipicephalus microplus]|uniref:Cuticular protein n=1 Tax=Rhipicephalus microplus TaxID=6941 RepID=A0A9J6DEY7_RHIMP|nr:hypothetical protein HPB51_002636 [Rhipicephalus microplus]
MLFMAVQLNKKNHVRGKSDCRYAQASSQHQETMKSQGNYRFGYDVVHSSGSSFHKEESTNGVKVGSYGLRDVDGRVRIVNYVADAQGFRADVQTNEPAVDPVKDSATTGQAVPSVDLMAVNASSGEDTAVVGPTEIPAASSTMVSSSVSVEPSGYPERAGGDVVPPKVLIDAADDVPRRTKPRPPVFPPPKEVDAPRRPGPPKRTTLRYPFYVDAADVHVVGPVPPAFPRRGFQLSQGGFPFTSPLSPATFGYFPAGATELHPAAMHPAYYANAASAFLHSMQLRHFPFGQLKWPYHAPFLPPPLVVF